jgi:hypothetical protein
LPALIRIEARMSQDASFPMRALSRSIAELSRSRKVMIRRRLDFGTGNAYIVLSP